MREFDYQRLIVGYHGCDVATRDGVIQEGLSLAASRNEYDWLGHGIYFWEHGPERALEWAGELKRRGRLREPAVLGAVLHLGRCFDLLDAYYADVLAEAFPDFRRSILQSNAEMPRNEPLNAEDTGRVLRKLDCAAINWTVERMDLEEPKAGIQTVRGLFQEGEEVFPESAIRRRSHIQVAVRDPGCIIGYFLPA